VKLFSPKRRVLLLAAAAVVVLFLVRPGASRLKTRIIYSMSSAVARPVDIGSVRLRFLPSPAFDLQKLVIYDDPSFGAEPIVRCDEVTASLRLTSLVRGHLEIARLDLTEPSLNLVRRPNGRWNLEALLEHTARTPLAPTAKAKTEPRPGFPYIEATSARINFMNGREKKPYALTNADFSLWQDSENSWGVRLKAQPFRTDSNLNDVGMLQVDGSWDRAESLQATPLQLKMNWSRAQLGQVTKFFTGNDQGWRGAAELNLTLSGTPSNLQITNSLVVQDFRRYDVTAGNPLRLTLRCAGRYSSPKHMFDDVNCQAPVGNGLITLKGSVGLPSIHTYDLVLSAEDVPASSALALFERAKKNLPDDLAAEGRIHGKFSMLAETGSSNPRFEGKGEISDFQLTSSENKAQIGSETVPFLLTDVAPAPPSNRRGIQQAAIAPAGARLEFGPVALGATHATSPVARGWINRSGYSISLSGETEVSRVLRLAKIVGIPALQTTAEGLAQLDLQIAGAWTNSGSTPPVASRSLVTGTVRLRNVRVLIRGAGPAEIASAELQLAPDGVHVRKLNASAAESVWYGSLDLPRGCGIPASCQVQFDLRTSQVSLISLFGWANPGPKSRPWYRMLETSASSVPSFLGSVHASGHIAADRLQAANMIASAVSANVTLESGKLEIAQLTTDLFQGKYNGSWQADFTEKPGTCTSKGRFTGVSLSQLAQSMNDRWITGAANATYELKGNCSAEFWSSAEGSLTFDIRDGTLPHVLLTESSEPLKLTTFVGQAKLHDGRVELRDARLDSIEAKYEVSGTASLHRQLNLKLARAAGGYTINGTLAEPRVSPASVAEQAKLKTDPAK